MVSNVIKVLLVDNDQNSLNFLTQVLYGEGNKLIYAKTGQEAIEIALAEVPNLILLDIVLPDMDGVEICTQLRNTEELNDTIIAFFSARTEVYSQIAGLNAGADDYILKTSSPKFLASKIKSLLRRILVSNTTSKKNLDDLIINPEQYKVTCHNQDFMLPRKEFELLRLLTSKPDKVFTRTEIYQKIWENNVGMGARIIDVYIHKLRDKLNTSKIKTIKGVGYKYELN
jgi:two-component system, OmpR family, alkaline phosphatase synthesis response regulator PhoP